MVLSLCILPVQSQYTQARKVKKRALDKLVLTGGGHARLFTAASNARASSPPAHCREARIEVGRLKQIVQSGGETVCGKGPRSFVCTV